MSSITFHDVSDFIESVKDMGLPAFTGNYSAYSRLGLSDVLPDDDGKILYFDCDTLIKGDISGLYDTNINGKICARIQDTCIGPKYYMLNGLPENYVYVNSGILLINLKEWRKFFGLPNVKEIMQSMNYLRYPDQDMINAVLFREDGAKYVSPRYDVFTPYLEWDIELLARAYPKIADSIYTFDELKEAADNPVIVHMVDGMNGRPWHKGNTNPLCAEWTDCLKESEFYADFEPFEVKSSIQHRILQWAYKHLPQRITLMIINLRGKLKRKKIQEEAAQWKKNMNQ